MLSCKLSYPALACAVIYVFLVSNDKVANNAFRKRCIMECCITKYRTNLIAHFVLEKTKVKLWKTRYNQKTQTGIGLLI